MQAEAKEFEEEFGVTRGNGKFKSAGKSARSGLDAEKIARGIEGVVEGRLQFEGNVNGGDGERTSREASTQLIEKTAEEKRERFEIVDGFIEFEPFFEVLRGFGEDERARAFAAGDGVE